MRVRVSSSLVRLLPRLTFGRAVDYILFLTADVTVTANENEIRDYKYVDKAELQEMFKNEGNATCLCSLRSGWLMTADT